MVQAETKGVWAEWRRPRVARGMRVEEVEIGAVGRWWK